MRIVYMGTPDFAVPPLKALAEAGYEIPLVVTQPDRARDRGKKVRPTPVKAACESLYLPVSQPERIKENPEFLSQLRAAHPDLIVVAAYGRILPREILELPPLGCVNIHASLLPRFRGAAPIQWSILSGDEDTGITLMYMEEGLDTGDMIASLRTSTQGKTAGDLHDELSFMGAKLLVDTLPEILQGRAARVKQDESLATYAPMVSKKDGLVDFSRSPEEIERQIRGLAPWPGAYTYLEGQPLKLLAAQAVEEENRNAPGTVTATGKEGISISAGGRTLLVTRLQAAGKKPMSAGDYLRGNQIEIFTRLG